MILLNLRMMHDKDWMKSSQKHNKNMRILLRIKFKNDKRDLSFAIIIFFKKRLLSVLKIL